LLPIELTCGVNALTLEGYIADVLTTGGAGFGAVGKKVFIPPRPVMSGASIPVDVKAIFPVSFLFTSPRASASLSF
jgi:hypothetical protein